MALPYGYAPLPTEVMAAVVFDKPGASDVLKVKDVQKPHLQTTKDVLIEVYASSVNKVDIHARSGDLSLLAGTSPHGCGVDFAGKIALIGSQVDRFKKGDDVYGFLPSTFTGVGAYAQYLVINQDYVTLKPNTLSFSEAAGVPLVALTAWQALVDVGKLLSNERVLIHGGAGGVGMWAIQLAKYLKAWVVVTCSTEHMERCKELGADMVIDYTKDHFYDIIAPGILDLVIDTIGGPIRDRSVPLIKKEGRIIELNPMGDDYQKHYGKGMGILMEVGKAATEKMVGSTLGPQRHYMIATPNATELTIISNLLDSGKVKTFVDREFQLAQVREAHEYVEKGHTNGKVIINMKARQMY